MQQLFLKKISISLALVLASGNYMHSAQKINPDDIVLKSGWLARPNYTYNPKETREQAVERHKLLLQNAAIEVAKKSKAGKVPSPDCKREALELIAEKMPGSYNLNTDAALAEKVIKTAPAAVAKLVADLKNNTVSQENKNIILYGETGSGKSAIIDALPKASKVPGLLFASPFLADSRINSGTQSIKNIFALAIAYGKPCVIGIHDLEVIIGTHKEDDNFDPEVLTTLFEEMENIKRKQLPIAVLLTLFKMETLPEHMRKQVTEIFLPFPNLEQREQIFAYELKRVQNKCRLSYADGFTARSLAIKSHGYSYRNLENLVASAIERAVLDDNRLVTMENVSKSIKEMEKWRPLSWVLARRAYEARYVCQDNPVPVVVATTAAGLAAWFSWNSRSKMLRRG